MQRLTIVHANGAARIPWHAHDCLEILLLLDGATVYEFLDRPSVELTGGHFMVIPSGTQHRGLHDIRRPANLVGVMFNLNEQPSADNFAFTRQESAWMEIQFQQAAQKPTRMGAVLRQLVKSLPREVAQFDAADIAVVATLRLSICAILMQAARQLWAVPTVQPMETVDRAIAYMKSHLPVTCSIEEVAAVVGCSRAKLFNIFKEATGLSPNDFWQRLRVDKAQELLSTTSKSITQIGLDCGFSSSQYFSTVFRKYADISPSAYRSQHASPTETDAEFEV